MISRSRLPVTGVILAGGRGSRLHGEDKGLIPLAGRPLLEHTIDALFPQTDGLIISANRNLDIYRRYPYPVVGDSEPAQSGPLAGIAAAMAVTRTPYLITAPCDCPFLPEDLVQCMLAAIEADSAQVCVIHDGQRLQPLIALLHCSLAPRLKASLEQGHLKVSRWMTEQPHVVLTYPSTQHAFFNINTPEALAQAEALCPRLAAPAHPCKMVG